MGEKTGAELNDLMRIDQRIDELVRQIELLSYVNPVNIEEQKKKVLCLKISYRPGI